MRERDFKGVVTAQGNQVRSLARQYQPAAITLDIFLPHILGWTASKFVKSRAPAPADPRAHGQCHERGSEKRLEACASDHIAKPVNIEELLALLRIWLFGTKRVNRKLLPILIEATGKPGVQDGDGEFKPPVKDAKHSLD